MRDNRAARQAVVREEERKGIGETLLGKRERGEGEGGGRDWRRGGEGQVGDRKEERKGKGETLLGKREGKGKGEKGRGGGAVR